METRMKSGALGDLEIVVEVNAEGDGEARVYRHSTNVRERVGCECVCGWKLDHTDTSQVWASEVVVMAVEDILDAGY